MTITGEALYEDGTNSVLFNYDEMTYSVNIPFVLASVYCLSGAVSSVKYLISSALDEISKKFLTIPRLIFGHT